MNGPADRGGPAAFLRLDRPGLLRRSGIGCEDRKLAAGLLVAFLACAGSSANARDSVEKLSGQKLSGTVLKEDKDYVTLRVRIGGGSLEMKVATKDIHAVTIKGARRVVNARPAGQRNSPARRTSAPRPAKPPKPVRKSTAKRKTRTSREVLALIQQQGRTKPVWWDSVQLNYPPTLDLTWKVYGRNWDTSRHLGQYIFSTVCANPSKFKEGVKLLHKCLDVNKNDPAKLDQTTGQLGNLYYSLLNDYARAAYWWGKTRGGGAGIRGNLDLGLADCYWRLGSKPMAAALLAGKFRSEPTPYGNVARLWSRMGEFATALRMAEDSAKKWPEAGHLTAGDVCRFHGRYKQALQYYQKAVSAGSSRNRRFKERAQASMDAIRAFEILDLSGIPDGTCSGDAVGFRGQVHVAVSVKSAKIVSAKVTGHKEDRPFCSIAEIPRRIVEMQGLKGVDAVSGATITSEAIINAAAKALASGTK